MEKRQISLVVLVGLLALVFAACTSFQISGIEVASKASAGTALGTFDIDVNINKWLGSSAGTNLFNISSDATDPKIIDAIKAEIEKLGGTKAINVKIEYKASFIQILLNSITQNIWAPATAHVTGTVIK
jgi:hypothetical protein